MGSERSLVVVVMGREVIRIISHDSPPTPLAIARDVGESNPLWFERVADQLNQALRSGHTASTRWSIALACPDDELQLVNWRRDEFIGTPDRGSVRLAIESVLPLDADRLELDLHDAGGWLRALAVNLEAVQPMVDALERRGLPVETIGSAALWLAQMSMTGSEPNGRVRQCQLQLGSMVDVMTLVDDRVLFWGRCDDADVAIETELAAQAWRLDPHASVPVESLPLERCRLTDDQRDATLCEAAAEIIAGRTVPWFELRRGELAKHDPLRGVRGPLDRLLLVASLALVVGGAAIWWRSQRYEARIAVANERTRQAFTTAFPDQRVPTAIVKRVQSEHAKVLGQRSLRGGLVGGVTPPKAAVLVLGPVIAAVRDVNATAASASDALPIVVDSIRIVDGQFVLDFRTPDYKLAGDLSKTLQEAGMDTEPPSLTRTGSDGVESRLQGKLRPASPEWSR